MRKWIKAFIKDFKECKDSYTGQWVDSYTCKDPALFWIRLINLLTLVLLVFIVLGGIVISLIKWIISL